MTPLLQDALKTVGVVAVGVATLMWGFLPSTAPPERPAPAAREETPVQEWTPRVPAAPPLVLGSPRLPDPAYPEVVALWDEGRAADALERLARLEVPDAGAPIEHALLRASLLDAVSKPAESAGVWIAIAEREPLLRDIAGTRAVSAYLAAAKPSAARETFERLTDGSARELWIDIADAFAAAGNTTTALDMYRRAAARGGASGDRAALAIARLQESAGDIEAALSTLRRVEVSFATSAAYVDARAHEKRLARANGRSPSPFLPAQYATLTSRLAGDSRYVEAVELLTEWRRQPGSDDEAIGARIVRTLYDMRANDEARAEAARFLARYPAGRHAADVRVIEFRLDIREGRLDEVRRRGRALWRGAVSGVPQAERDSIGLLLAAYLVAAGDVEGGLSIYSDLYREARSRGRRVDILWRAGVAAVRAGQIDRGITNLEGVLALRPGPETTLAARYWLAAARLAGGDRSGAVSLFQTLAAQAPREYYGIEAAARLNELGVARAPVSRRSFPSLSVQSVTERHPAYRAALLLAAAGMKQDAAAQARTAAAAHRGDRAAGLVAARASLVAGDFREAHRWAALAVGSFLDREIDGAPPDLWRLIYPLAYWDSVSASAARQNVDPLLLLALARQESRFDATAVSAVGAVGMFQVMSYTAEVIAPQVDLPIPGREELMDPAVSAAIAARLVRNLLDEFGGALEPAIASYNAGEERVGDWWRAAEGLPVEMFVDSIPYTQTRGYVREVLTNLHMYREVYSQSSLPTTGGTRAQ